MVCTRQDLSDCYMQACCKHVCLIGTTECCNLCIVCTRSAFTKTRATYSQHTLGSIAASGVCGSQAICPELQLSRGSSAATAVTDPAAAAGLLKNVVIPPGASAATAKLLSQSTPAMSAMSSAVDCQQGSYAVAAASQDLLPNNTAARQAAEEHSEDATAPLPGPVSPASPHRVQQQSTQCANSGVVDLTHSEDSYAHRLAEAVGNDTEAVSRSIAKLGTKRSRASSVSSSKKAAAAKQRRVSDQDDAPGQGAPEANAAGVSSQDSGEQRLPVGTLAAELTTDISGAFSSRLSRKW